MCVCIAHVRDYVLIQGKPQRDRVSASMFAYVHMLACVCVCVHVMALCDINAAAHRVHAQC